MMKLSICIPIYNFDVRNLVTDLANQIESQNIDAEIILIDDASTKDFVLVNAALKSVVKHFIFLEKNVGRSAVRNLFLEYVLGDYLLFLDCDSMIIRPDFISNYVDYINNHPQTELLYGGFLTNQGNNNLRNFYSIKREISTQFNTSNYSTFKTINFVIRKNVFKKYPFCEVLKNYGYEDYIFAKILEKNKIGYVFINNPVIHMDNTTNNEFLSKIKEGMQSLYLLSSDHKFAEYIKDIKVYRFSNKIKSWHLNSIFLKLYHTFEKKILKNLNSQKPNIYYLDIFKLAKLLEIQKISQVNK